MAATAAFFISGKMTQAWQSFFTPCFLSQASALQFWIISPQAFYTWMSLCIAVGMCLCVDIWWVYGIMKTLAVCSVYVFAVYYVCLFGYSRTMCMCECADSIARDRDTVCRWRTRGWGQFPAGSRLLRRFMHAKCTKTAHVVWQRWTFKQLFHLLHEHIGLWGIQDHWGHMHRLKKQSQIL